MRPSIAMFSIYLIITITFVLGIMFSKQGMWTNGDKLDFKNPLHWLMLGAILSWILMWIVKHYWG